MNRLLYAIHKWVSALAFLQLTVWSVTGFLFAFLSQEAMKSTPVAGAHDAALAHAPKVEAAAAMIAASAAGDLGPIARVELRALPSGAFWVVRGAKGATRIDAESGKPAPVDKTEAEATARRDQPGAPAVASAALLTESPPIDYRDGVLPAWQVELADGHHTRVFVDATTGEVVMRRNDRWRSYDFLWALHIMDYRGRENFNHPLMLAAASLAVLTVFSGIVLLVVRFTRWLGRFRKKAAAKPAAAAS